MTDTKLLQTLNCYRHQASIDIKLLHLLNCYSQNCQSVNLSASQSPVSESSVDQSFISQSNLSVSLSPVCQSVTSQSTSRSVSQTVSQPVDQSVDQSVRQSVSQSVSEPAIQSTCNSRSIVKGFFNSDLEFFGLFSSSFPFDTVGNFKSMFEIFFHFLLICRHLFGSTSMFPMLLQRGSYPIL